MAAPSPLWTPSPERAARAHMHAFMQRIHRVHGVAAEWEALRTWALAHRDDFWSELLRFAEIEPSRPADAVLTGTNMLDTRWFVGMQLNYARHMLRHDDDRDAVLFANEVGCTAGYSHRALRAEVARCAAALRGAGLRRGDRVAAFMPNLPETLIAMLATAASGAIWSSCSPDFGTRAVLDRFGQIEPTILFVPDGYSYGGKTIDCRGRVAELLAELPTVRRAVVVPYPFKDGDLDRDLAPLRGGAASRPVEWWREFLGPLEAAAPPLSFEELPFDHPLFIMYSSGTTGVPKCIVHGHGGTLLQHMKELMLHSDVHRDDRLFYFTTCGWMMWNWLVSGLGIGAAVVLYEGNPAHPTVHRLWELAGELKITHFGTSPKFLAACQKAHLAPGREHNLAALRCVLSTGSPLSEELFRWVYENVKTDLQLASICGGTDIISCFMLGNPLLPVYAGEIQCRGLAMDVQAWDDAGRPVTKRKGELVCTQAFPSQPVGFWNDPDGAKYRKAYFDFTWQRPDGSRPPPVWRHGDYIEVTGDGGIIVYGRSDATLNPGGVRIGTAELYRLVESVPEVTDSIACARRVGDDEEIALFVILRPGLTLDAALTDRIRQTIAAGATKRHVPRLIRQVTAIPYTISGKKVELAVQQMLHGEEVRNRDALANPDALEQFRNPV
ncbi:MAG: acetoacetate--CoA ligase [Phycisphaerae bacterium]